MCLGCIDQNHKDHTFKRIPASMFKVHKGVSDTLDKLKDWKATVSESLKQIVNTEDMNKKTEAEMPG